MEKSESRIILTCSLILAFLLLFPYLATVPGLHGDEAWVGLRAHEILRGARPLFGMNYYTGPIHQYLEAPILNALGFQVEVLRAITALASLTCVFLYYYSIRCLFDRSIGALSALILVCMPFFTAYGRIATENFALNPVLALGSISLLLASRDGPPQGRIPLCLLSGVCLGLGTWNHMIFISVPFALAVTTIYNLGVSSFRLPGVYATSAGFLLVLLFRLAAGGMMTMNDGLGLPGGVWRRMVEWPGLFLEIIHGDILFQRFSGEVIFEMPHFMPLVLLIGIIISVKDFARSQVITFTIALFSSTLVLCPGNSDRYFLLLLYLVPLGVAFIFHTLLRCSLPRSLTLAFLGGFVVLQVSRLGINYFGSQLSSHGRTSHFLLGSQVETSNHFIRTDKLYRELIAQGAKHVWAEFFIAMPLRFYDLEQRKLVSIIAIEEERRLPSASENLPPGTFVVVYAGGLSRVGPGDFPGFEVVSKNPQFLI
jgi:4-amino-4-deoxy-L-arabinose transferase-like glycosyltransferase